MQVEKFFTVTFAGKFLCSAEIYSRKKFLLNKGDR